MDLTEAARKTLDEASDLVEVFDSAGKKLDEADDRLEQVERRFEQQWQPLERAGRELLEDIRKLKETLDEEAKRQVAELVGLKGRVTWAKEHGSEVIHATLNEVNAFTQRAKDLDPELDAALDQVEQVGHQLRDRAKEIEAKLLEATQEVSALMNGEIVSDIHTMQSELEERLERLKGYVTGESLPQIKEKAEALEQKLDEFKENLQHKLDELKEQAEASARESVEKALAKHHEIFEQFTKTGEQVKGMLEKLSKAVEDGGTAIGEGKDAIEAGVKGTSVGLQAAIGTLDELMSMFKKFSFIPGI
jgi:ABC-type transporter Mla subunit MlaD